MYSSLSLAFCVCFITVRVGFNPPPDSDCKRMKALRIAVSFWTVIVLRILACVLAYEDGLIALAVLRMGSSRVQGLGRRIACLSQRRIQGLRGSITCISHAASLLCRGSSAQARDAIDLLTKAPKRRNFLCRKQRWTAACSLGAVCWSNACANSLSAESLYTLMRPLMYLCARASNEQRGPRIPQKNMRSESGQTSACASTGPRGPRKIHLFSQKDGFARPEKNSDAKKMPNCTAKSARRLPAPT